MCRSSSSSKLPQALDSVDVALSLCIPEGDGMAVRSWKLLDWRQSYPFQQARADCSACIFLARRQVSTLFYNFQETFPGLLVSPTEDPLALNSPPPCTCSGTTVIRWLRPPVMALQSSHFFQGCWDKLACRNYPSWWWFVSSLKVLDAQCVKDITVPWSP